MHGAATRRMQYSSCDECRRSRVSCDAMSRGGSDNGASRSPSCTRCINRQRSCTFKWIKDAKGKVPTRALAAANETRRMQRPAAGTIEASTPGYVSSSRAQHRRTRRQSSPAPAHPEPTSSPRAEEQSPGAVPPPVSPPAGLEWVGLCPTPSSVGAMMMSRNSHETPRAQSLYSALSPSGSDALSSVNAEWLSNIYREGFEAIFGSWMGRYSCPFSFGESSTADKHVSISDLCGQLDRWMTESADYSRQTPNGHDRHRPSDLDAAIDSSLGSSIAAFAARWIPLASQPARLDADALSIVQKLWRHARRDMLRVINRPSYRSMLALLLFALTPIPTGILEEEEVDGISGQACVHAALQQIQTLRARQRNLQFSGSKVSPSSPAAPAVVTSPDSLDASAFINAESTAYWAALTFDTSASLTLNCRSLLSSGLFGFEAESSWRLVRTCAQMFSETAQSWQRHGDRHGTITDERANQIIAAAAAWKLLGWKLTAVFKEALRDGHDEAEIHKAYLMVVDSIKEFNRTFRHLLEACQRRMQFLQQQTKLRWYSLMLHYHLSILMFVDIIEATGRYDLLSNLQEATTDAESAVMNCFVFGQHNTFTLNFISASSDDRSSASTISNPSSGGLSVPLISIDPYPHHVVAGVQLLRKAIDRDLKMKRIADDTHANLFSILERTISLLPQSSKSVKAATSEFTDSRETDSGLYFREPFYACAGLNNKNSMEQDYSLL